MKNTQIIHHHKRLIVKCVAIGLIITMALLFWWFVSLAPSEQTQLVATPNLTLVPTHTPTVMLNPTQTPTRIPIVDPPSASQILIPLTPTPIRKPDLRFAELRKRYGLRVEGDWWKECDAPCTTAIVNLTDGKPVTIAELVARLGPPEKVYVSLYSGGERAQIVAELFYIQQGFVIFARRPTDAKAEITPNMLVDRLDLYTSRTAEGIIPEMIKMWGTATPLHEAEDWKGFGSVKVHGR
jgi:hypothetical protein